MLTNKCVIFEMTISFMVWYTCKNIKGILLLSYSLEISAGQILLRVDWVEETTFLIHIYAGRPEQYNF